jgi:thiamine biosynthesis protein ThiS
VDRVAVEHNGAIVRRADRPVTRVNDGDVFEIVTLVGGG